MQTANDLDGISFFILHDAGSHAVPDIHLCFQIFQPEFHINLFLGRLHQFQHLSSVRRIDVCAVDQGRIFPAVPDTVFSAAIYDLQFIFLSPECEKNILRAFHRNTVTLFLL